jgi:hypothetical protein
MRLKTKTFAAFFSNKKRGEGLFLEAYSKVKTRFYCTLRRSLYPNPAQNFKQDK